MAAAPGTPSPLYLPLPGELGYLKRDCFSPAQGPTAEPPFPSHLCQIFSSGLPGVRSRHIPPALIPALVLEPMGSLQADNFPLSTSPSSPLWAWTPALPPFFRRAPPPFF